MSEIADAAHGASRTSSFPARWLGAAMLRTRRFGEVDADPHALGQAAIVVLVGGLARGIAVFPDEGWIGLVGGAAVGVVMWIVATVLVWAIGVHALAHAAELPPLLRSLGFAAAPLAGLVVCAALPPAAARVLWWALHVVATLAFAVSVRVTLDVPPARALWICTAALGSALLLLLGAAAFLIDTVLLD